jgi:hypothetical protein
VAAAVSFLVLEALRQQLMMMKKMLTTAKIMKIIRAAWPSLISRKISSS